jgi:hypothetical protein
MHPPHLSIDPVTPSQREIWFDQILAGVGRDRPRVA